MTLEFVGKATPLAVGDIAAVAADLGVEPAAVAAVAEVESSGSGFLSDKRPKILFERHVFSRRTKGRFDGTHPDISSSLRGGYGAGGAHQYERLAEAIALDRDAALQSASWGRFQIMGFNHKSVGYDDAESFVAAMCESEREHLAAFGEFCRSNNLVNALQTHDWTRFARGYNGAGQQGYDTKIAGAYARHLSDAPEPAPQSDRAPARKPKPKPPPKPGRVEEIDVSVDLMPTAVKMVQLLLRGSGVYEGEIDGKFGPQCEEAMREFRAWERGQK